jgi:hypothetical protein
MNIPIEVIVAQMEKEITKIKKEFNINKKKESVAAVKVLCDLILEEDSEKEMAHAEDTMLKKMVGETKVINKGKIPENDANGDSLFDF